ncbi:hypothetical protein J3459_017453 [Metarhizium acridum]|uniref:Integral membrane protein n=1 Tax=Metarhizium acridum (strain CQMa 102) TaxID=655827 RepID=E9EHB7_METAQ|nr:uncharacterized protein MAC_09265 [Metarhizium acridum CQMa 102]EFY84675.1 hypothetical protein MAC_09265 [Metarhizium acridum CQMa 102]KAG8406073.1 hypothetical protein J3458_021409 [Metarhizium acridum]KAG8409494.1 hypothetical protein J3459_017453 [Metarhizium acridum]
MSSTEETLSADGVAPGAQEPSSTPEMCAVKEAVPAAPSPQRATPAAIGRASTEHRVSVSVSAAVHHRQPPVKLVKQKGGQWALARDGRLINNLSRAVGFMELANAGDFAANVWNDIPVPIYAIVFMAIGGTVAGFLSIFAFRDAKRACCNVRYLRAQRRLLLEEKRQLKAGCESTLEMDVLLAINFRELGTELVTRWIMDLLMGFGAILICVGTYMAIGGANPSVFLASNLLSGYVGNTPIALFGLCNSSWAAFIFTKAQRHISASRNLLGSCAATALVKRRARKVQVFSVINGTATILGGVGSMITATRWWGYVILIPVIISSVFCNIWWRRMIGYTRSEGHPAMARDELIYALEFAAASEVKSLEDPEAPPAWCSELPSSLGEMLQFLIRHSLIHQYCADMIADPRVCQALGGNATDQTELSISPESLLALPADLQQILLDNANRMAREVGPDHFKNRERYLAEILGTYCTLALRHGIIDDSDSAERREKNTEKI